jgi:peptidoglycan/xylan/chitin deacetylase (PgdA/CDA1 family)
MIESPSWGAGLRVRSSAAIVVVVAGAFLAGCDVGGPEHGRVPAAVAAGSAATAGPALGVARGPATVPPAPAPASSETQWTTGTQDVALTFDDGPDPVTTPKLLDLLMKYDVKATFCLVGHRVRDNQAVVRRIVAEGHTLCNHSWQHLQDLGKRPDRDLAHDLEATNEQIHRAVPGARIAYFRAPYGNFSKRLNGFAAARGMKPLGWNVSDECSRTDTFGQGDRMIRHMTKMVRRDARPGAVILSHDLAKPFTVTAYDALLPWLKQRFTLIALPVAAPASP